MPVVVLIVSEVKTSKNSKKKLGKQCRTLTQKNTSTAEKGSGHYGCIF